MKTIKMVIAGLLMIPAIALAVVPSAQAQYTLTDGVNAAKTESQKEVDANEAVTNFVNIFLWVIGILSVIMIIWGGIRYTTSAGDSNKVTAAKNTIVYAVIGLVIAILSYALVNFVVKTISE